MRKDFFLDALIFDFDGVLVDSEPIHLHCYQQVLESLGVKLSREDYYAKYLGYDDHDCFIHVLDDLRISHNSRQIQELIERKTALVTESFQNSIQPLPGAVEFIRQAEMLVTPMAICSGALRNEIELAAQTIGIRESMMAIIAAEDVERGKPDPEGYVLALERLIQLTGRVLRADKTIVVEDSPAGISAAKDAGMKVLALTTSYRPSELTQADKIVRNLADIRVAELERLV